MEPEGDLRILHVTAVLFDLDGVLADSTEAVESVWREFATRHGINLESLLRGLHGRRMVEIVGQELPTLGAADRDVEIERIGAEEVRRASLTRPHHGALEFVACLPDGGWAVVTSGTRAIAEARLEAIGLSVPPVFVTADDVDEGKPSSMPYLKACSALHVAPETVLVVEDSPSGVTSARAAGCTVIAVTTSHAPAALAHASYIVEGLHRVERVESAEGADRRMAIAVHA